MIEHTRHSEAPSGPAKEGVIGDALVLTFTPGVSLRMWADEGLIAREWALYERLRPHYRRLVIITYGDGRDRDIGEGLAGGPEVICNDAGLADPAYVASIPARAVKVLAGGAPCRRVVIKTNQNQGGDVAVDVAAALRRAGVATALVARGGYLRSRFRAWEFGADSADCRRTAEEEGRLCRAADMVIGPGPMVEDLAWRFAIPASRTAVVPNFVLLDGDPVTDAGARARDDVLFAGRLVEQKRIDVLIDAVASVREMGFGGVRLTLVGDGPLRDELEARARERRVDVVFHRREAHHEVLARMRRCAVYAQAAAYEGGSPKTVIEAMAAGAPVVVANTYGTGNCVSNDVTGLSTALDAGEMARAIARLLGDASLRERLGRDAAAWVRAEHGLPVIVEKELAAHRRAMAAGSARGAGRGAGRGAVRADEGTGVSVLMPVLEAGAHFDEAMGSVLGQTHRDLEILVVLNGSSRATRERVHEVARRDTRIRVEELERANLAAALNHGLRSARHELVARMDGDDWSAPERVARQVAFMRRHPQLAAAGTAYEIIDEHAGVLDVVRPATDPGELRWRLLIGNTCAHGSMMLRREDVLGAGGYDETLERAQDYELWLRLSRSGGVGNVEDVLYRHRLRGAQVGLGATSGAQAEAAARLMVEEWTRLAREGGDEAGIVRTIAAALAGSESALACAGGVARAMEEGGAELAGLVGWLWARERAGRGAERALVAGRRARVREMGAALREEGIGSVWIMGAGVHTRGILAGEEDLGVRIAGVVDDARVGERVGEFEVVATTGVEAGECVVISSDWHEDALWRASASMRARGVRVWRLYGDGEPAGRGVGALGVG